MFVCVCVSQHCWGSFAVLPFVYFFCVPLGYPGYQNCFFRCCGCCSWFHWSHKCNIPIAHWTTDTNPQSSSNHRPQVASMCVHFKASVSCHCRCHWIKKWGKPLLCFWVKWKRMKLHHFSVLRSGHGFHHHEENLSFNITATWIWLTTILPIIFK